MLCSISSFTKWRPQFIEIQLVLVLEVMALPAHAHMDARLSIKKGKKSVPSWILCFQFEDFVHLSLHLSRPVSTSRWRDDIYNERILNRLLWVEDYAFSMVSTTAQWVVLLLMRLHRKRNLRHHRLWKGHLKKKFRFHQHWVLPECFIELYLKLQSYKKGSASYHDRNSMGRGWSSYVVLVRLLISRSAAKRVLQ